jgi:hypothetical protein
MLADCFLGDFDARGLAAHAGREVEHRGPAVAARRPS